MNKNLHLFDFDEFNAAESEYADTEYGGMLIIGDPHVEARVPGFRKDDYPRTILEKLRWSLNLAREKAWLPVILGDLFQLPRDNPNWLIVELLEMFDQPIVGIYGNHDVHENTIDENDSLSILAQAGRLSLLSEENLLRLKIAGRRVLIGGTPWGRDLPTSIPRDESDPLVIWFCHHDLIVPGYEEAGKIRLDDSLEIDVIVNGHIHRRLETTVSGGTTILTPGNITRRKRGDVTREHVPAVMALEVSTQGWNHQFIEVPHRSFDEVFYEAVIDTPDEQTHSRFVAGLAELKARRTETGAGLQVFLDANVRQFEPQVARQIQILADEVLQGND